jgi:uncharacterized membrane protein SirB2
LNWSKVALITMLVVSGLLLVLPRVVGVEVEAWPDAVRWASVTALLVAMVILGRDERRRERAEDSWVDDARKSKSSANWIEKRRQRFSPKRGLGFFIAGLVVFSITVGFTAITGTVASTGGAIAFVLSFSVLAGLIGMFTEKVPL